MPAPFAVDLRPYDPACVDAAATTRRTLLAAFQPTLVVLTVPKAADNIASRRLSERQEMRLIRTEIKDCVAGRLPTEIWELTAEEWRKAQDRK